MRTGFQQRSADVHQVARWSGVLLLPCHPRRLAKFDKCMKYIPALMPLRLDPQQNIPPRFYRNRWQNSLGPEDSPMHAGDGIGLYGAKAPYREELQGISKEECFNRQCLVSVDVPPSNSDVGLFGC